VEIVANIGPTLNYLWGGIVVSCKVEKKVRIALIKLESGEELIACLK
jgi:hypothetical protein